MGKKFLPGTGFLFLWQEISSSCRKLLPVPRNIYLWQEIFVVPWNFFLWQEIAFCYRKYLLVTIFLCDKIIIFDKKSCLSKGKTLKFVKIFILWVTNRKWNYEHVSVLPFIFASCSLTIEGVGRHYFPLKWFIFSYWI